VLDRSGQTRLGGHGPGTIAHQRPQLGLHQGKTTTQK
jgi:hypothetical protein